MRITTSDFPRFSRQVYVREPLIKSMIGIRTTETTNYVVAKLGNIPDIPCVLRLVFGRLSAPTARPGLIQRFLRSISILSIERFIAGIVFALSAATPALIALPKTNGPPLFYHLYYVSPMICAFISAFILGEKLVGINTKETYKYLYCAIISLVIVLLSLILWIIPAAILLPPHERMLAPTIALLAGTMFGWATYPPGIAAGLVVHSLFKLLPKNALQQSDTSF